MAAVARILKPHTVMPASSSLTVWRPDSPLNLGSSAAFFSVVKTESTLRVAAGGTIA